MGSPKVLEATTPDVSVLAYVIACPTGNRYLVYSSAVFGDTSRDRPERWFFRPYPVDPGIAEGEPFHTSGDAEQAAHFMDVLRAVH